jgi:hypothetical protein
MLSSSAVTAELIQLTVVAASPHQALLSMQPVQGKISKSVVLLELPGLSQALILDHQS